MDPLDTCPIPGRRDTSKAARRRTRLAICAEKWADGEDPTYIMHTWGTTYDGMRSMIRANPDIKLPDDMAKRLHKICREGNNLDDESGLPHLAHAAWHCLALFAYQQHDAGVDTRNPWNTHKGDQ